MHSVILKNGALWGAKKPNDCSWVWNKILKMRSLTQPLIKTIIGNGQGTSFWFDNWHPMGLLYQKFSEKLLKSFRIKKEAVVADCVANGEWIGLL